jgi:hypothetical protein
MKSFFSELLCRVRELANAVLAKTPLAQRARLRIEANQRKANETERLDRLRNPSDYHGR